MTSVSGKVQCLQKKGKLVTRRLTFKKPYAVFF